MALSHDKVLAVPDAILCGLTEFGLWISELSRIPGSLKTLEYNSAPTCLTLSIIEILEFRNRAATPSTSLINGQLTAGIGELYWERGYSFNPMTHLHYLEPRSKPS